jgi:hypothetical protein
MADKRISELTALTGANVADTDLLPIVDTSATETKKITFAEFKTALDTATGFVRITGDTMTGNLSFGDNNKAIFGASSDLQIYHDSSNSYIADTGTGDLYIQAGNEIFLQNTAGITYFYGNQAGQSTVGYAGTAKLATTSTGIEVSGTVVADGLTVENSSLDVVFKDTQTHTTTDGPALQFQGKGPNGTNYNFGYVQGLSNGVNNAGDIVIGTNTAGVSYQRLRIEDNGDISFYEDTGTTAKFFWDSSAESLGIGTTSPSTILDVSGTSATLTLRDSRVSASWTAGTALGKLDFYTSDATGIGPHSVASIGVVAGGDNAASPDGELVFATGPYNTASSERMRIDSSGNVGIGTSSPLTTLHVNSTYGTGYTGAFSGVSSYNPTSSEMLIGTLLGSAASAGDYTGLRFNISGNGSGVASASIIASREAAEGNGNTSLSFLTRTGTSSLTERLRIDSSGKLLVGKTAAGDYVTGVEFQPAGAILSYRTTNVASIFGRTNDGEITRFTSAGAIVGSIGAKAGDLVVGTGDTGLRFSDASSIIEPQNITTNSGTDGTVDLGWSSGRFKDLYLSGGVYLGGTVAANYLDSYEEGTFVPVLADATTGGNTSPTVFTGKYTKIGRLVHVTLGLFNIDTTGMTSGNAMYVRGLPFTPTASVNSQGSCTLDRINFTGFVSAQVSTAGAYLFLNDMVDSALEVILTVASVVVSGGSDMSISVTYMTDA